MRLSGLKRLLGPEPHLEPAVDWERLKEYCRKEESRVSGLAPVTWGADLGQGRRSDLADLADKVLEGTALSRIAKEDPCSFIKYHKGLQALKTATTTPFHGERNCFLFWGLTGAGKTRMVYDYFAPDSIYNVFCTKSPWFDGYEGQEIALFDECGPGMMSHNFLKKLLDRYPITVPVKGGSANWNAKTIVLTSNVCLDLWFSIPTEDMDALKRRLKIFYFPTETEQARRALLQLPADEHDMSLVLD